MRKIFAPLLICISFFGCDPSTGDKESVTENEDMGVELKEIENIVAIEDTAMITTDNDKLLAEEYVRSGTAKRDVVDYAGAITDYTKAIELNPTYADAYYTRGITKIAFGDKGGGCVDLSKAEELGHSRANEKKEIYCK